MMVELGADLIPSLVELSDYYLPHGHFPDKAIDVMDLCCVRTKRNKETTVSADCVREVIREMAHIPLDPSSAWRAVGAGHAGIQPSPFVE